MKSLVEYVLLQVGIKYKAIASYFIAYSCPMMPNARIFRLIVDLRGKKSDLGSGG